MDTNEVEQQIITRVMGKALHSFISKLESKSFVVKDYSTGGNYIWFIDPENPLVLHLDETSEIAPENDCTESAMIFIPEGTDEIETFIVPCDERERAYIIHCSLSQAYKNFYDWINRIKLEYQYSDFPRDYIVLSKVDEAIMHGTFGKNILRQNNENL